MCVWVLFNANAKYPAGGIDAARRNFIDSVAGYRCDFAMFPDSSRPSEGRETYDRTDAIRELAKYPKVITEQISSLPCHQINSLGK